ncbi:MAG: 4'-phosphopantetheinyl transferase family protein [Flammeovirgaceae bacterium]
MPIIKTDSKKKCGGWAIWQIDEMEEELAFHAQEQCPGEIINESKRLEWLASRNALKFLVEKMGVDYFGVNKNQYGKPFLKQSDFHISLSHSYPFAAAQIAMRNEVGIDLEQPTEKLLRVAPRVLSHAELKDAGTDVLKHCIYWCAKEALYKIDGKKGLHSSNQINIEPFHLKAAGDLVGTIRKNRNHILHLSYLVEKEFVVVYTKPAMP